MSEEAKKLFVETKCVGLLGWLVRGMMKVKLVGIQVRCSLIPAGADEIARSKLILPGDKSPWSRQR